MPLTVTQESDHHVQRRNGEGHRSTISGRMTEWNRNTSRVHFLRNLSVWEPLRSQNSHYSKRREHDQITAKSRR